MSMKSTLLIGLVAFALTSVAILSVCYGAAPPAA
jgi:hypothetical protein